MGKYLPSQVCLCKGDKPSSFRAVRRMCLLKMTDIFISSIILSTTFTSFINSLVVYCSVSFHGGCYLSDSNIRIFFYFAFSVDMGRLRGRNLLLSLFYPLKPLFIHMDIQMQQLLLEWAVTPSTIKLWSHYFKGCKMPTVRKLHSTSLPATTILFALVKVQGRETHNGWLMA